MNVDPAFTELVQLHERTWGTDTYPKRPTLMELLNSPVVAMWSSTDRKLKDRVLFSTHQSIAELEEVLSEILLVSKVTVFNERKLSRLYYKQRPVKFKLRVTRDTEEVPE